jgi:hypothetical protein
LVVCFQVSLEEKNDLYTTLSYESGRLPEWVAEVVFWEQFPASFPWKDSRKVPILWRNRILTLQEIRAKVQEAKAARSGNKHYSRSR